MVSSLINKQSVIFSRETRQWDLQQLAPPLVLPLHKLVKGHVPKAGISIVVLRPDNSNGIALVGADHVAGEATLVDAGQTAAYNGIDEEEHEVFVVDRGP